MVQTDLYEANLFKTTPRKHHTRKAGFLNRRGGVTESGVWKRLATPPGPRQIPTIF